MTDFIGGKLGTKNSPLEEYPRSGGGVLTSSENTRNIVVESSSMETPRHPTGTTSHEGNLENLFETNQNTFTPTSPLHFSPEATAVFDAGKELWKYYHTKHGDTVAASTVNKYNPNASLYDIREYFQGRNETGKMNNKSSDTEYSKLIANLRESLKLLALKIQLKVYQYGFLRK